MKSWQRVLIACGTIALMAGCGDDDPGAADAGGQDAGAQDAGGPDAAPGPGALRRTIPLAERLDVLFVVDESGGMAEEQAAVGAGLQALFERLQTRQGGLPDLHVGVVSTTLEASQFIQGCLATDSDDGALLAAFDPSDAACADGSLAIDGSFLRDAPTDEAGRDTNYTGELTQVLSCMIRLGVAGCGFEQPLAAMRRAFENPLNAGFLRTDAALAVVFVTTEDDCSAMDLGVFDPMVTGRDSSLGPLSSFRCFEFGVACTPDDPRALGEKDQCVPREDSPYLYGVDEFVSFLAGIKPDPQQVVVAGIVGVDPAAPDAPLVVIEEESLSGELGFALAPACQRTDAGGAVVAEADPAVRLRAFLEAFPGRNQLVPICEQDLSGALDGVGALLARAVDQRWCLRRDMDRAPEVPGIQHACQVREQRYQEGSVVSERPWVECSSSAPAAGELPCWRFAEPSDRCDGDAPVELILAFDGPPTDGTMFDVRCSDR